MSDIPHSDPPARAMHAGSMLAKTPMDAKVAAIIAPVVGDMGFEIVRVRLTGAKRPVLQIMAERPDGTIDVDDCAEISRVVSALLDVEDPIDREYVLEVSSPGVDRPLTRPGDFARYKGFEAKIELAEPTDGRKRYRGVLAGLDPQSGAIVIETADLGAQRFAFGDLADAKLVLTDELIAASLKGQAGRPAADGVEIEVGDAEDAQGGGAQADAAERLEIEHDQAADADGQDEPPTKDDPPTQDDPPTNGRLTQER